MEASAITRPDRARFRQRDEEQRGRRGTAGGRPASRYLRLRTAPLLGQRAVNNDRRHQADRQVQVEDPAPRDGIRDDAADERSHNRRDAPDAAEHRLHPRPLGQRVDFADDRERQRNQAAGAQDPAGRGRARAAASTATRRRASTRRGTLAERSRWRLLADAVTRVLGPATG